MCGESQDQHGEIREQSLQPRGRDTGPPAYNESEALSGADSDRAPVDTHPNERGGRPVQTAIRMIGGKWKAAILLELDTIGVLRFKELQRRLRPISQKALTRALHELRADGLVARATFSEMPLRVEYSLTGRSESLIPILAELKEWVQGAARRRAREGAASAAVYRR